ncbi:tripartite tricarboxylate transporter permease [Archaeoglobus sulfaticallidus]|nr:tripartite tricarboxylate transporter permease [Archaeoglobus sulfaticallidus]
MDFLPLAVGILLGIVSGLLPGIHNNTFSALMISNIFILTEFFEPEEIALIIFANSITHTFLDILPTVFIGAPDEDTAVSILPAHAMLLDGRGFEAVSISAFSSLISYVLSIPVFFVLLNLSLKGILMELTAPFLILVVILLILSEREDRFAGSLNRVLRMSEALAIILLSGVIGYIAFKYSFLFEVRAGGNIFIPMMIGFFSIPVLIQSRKTSIPDQRIELAIPGRRVFHGCAGGFLVSMFPGVSSGIASVISSFSNRKEEEYITSVSSANTSNALLCYAIFFSMGFKRSGAVDAFSRIVSDLDYGEIRNLILLGAIVVVIAFFVTILLGYIFSRVLREVDTHNLSKLLIVFLVAYTYFMTGTYGILFLITSTIVGLLAAKLGVRRINCMGCVILPSILLRV